MKLCAYVVTYDGGSAPNPFFGYCTLAICTPNHRGLKLEAGDWIVGLLNKSRGYKLLYAMEISEKLDFGDYFADKRFEKKKFKAKGNWKEKCGDNIYKRNNGNLEPYPRSGHPREGKQANDMKYPTVFIAKKENFYYFGKNAKNTPKIFEDTCNKKGNIPRLKYHYQPQINKFISWLKNNHKPGIHGNPNDNKETC